MSSQSSSEDARAILKGNRVHMKKVTEQKLNRHLSPLGLIAFSLGTAIGWGSLVVTSSTYLAQSGLAGSIIGMILGGIVMLIIARNYSYLMQIYPDSGGAYTYTKEVFGADYGFLTAWFLVLTYMSVLWANATSIPLFSRYFIGPVLQFGKLYTIFGYDIYVGEIIVTIAALLLTALVCSRARRASTVIMIAMAAVFTAGILIVGICSITGHRMTWQPLYVPETKALSQIVRIAVISPWAFIGFESVSHGAAEFSFKRDKVFRYLVISVVITTLLYILITMASVTAYPERYGSWLEYIRDRGNLEGLEALPAFYAAKHYMGNTGVSILMAALMALIISSLIGNTSAVSRLFLSMGRDGLLPENIGRLNDRALPANAMYLIAGLSLFIPFVGRTAIGWIVDVTTIGATLIYALVSGSAAVKAGRRADRIERITGLAGVVIMAGYGLYTLIPNLTAAGSIERETFFIFIVWTLLGFVYFRIVLERDKERKYGKSVIVWAAMLAILLFISVVWMRQSMIVANNRMIDNVRTHYSATEDSKRREDEEFIEKQISELEENDTNTVVMTMSLFALAVIMMFSNHSFLNKRTRESEMIANRDPLTGVKSKHAYLVKQKEIDEAIAETQCADFAVVVCDVNGLKHINDTQGHKAGDEYICAASAMICEIYQHSPVYRLGGDEFTVILSGHDYDIREELLQMLHNRSVDNISLGRVVVSGGMSMFEPESDHDFHTVFERADELMYKEKMLLKSLGAVTRDDSAADLEDASVVGEEEDIELIRKRVSKSIEFRGEDEAVNSAHLREELTNLFKKEYFWMGVAKYDELYPDTPMDAVMVDINRFHMINERFGREFGDDVLRHMGVCIQNYAKHAGGIACRRKVDEFEIYCPHRASYSDIEDFVMEGGTDAGRIAAARLRIGVYANVDKSLRVGQRFDRAKLAADSVRNGHNGEVGYFNESMYEDALRREEQIDARMAQ